MMQKKSLFSLNQIMMNRKLNESLSILCIDLLELRNSSFVVEDYKKVSQNNLLFKLFQFVLYIRKVSFYIHSITNGCNDLCLSYRSTMDVPRNMG